MDRRSELVKLLADDDAPPEHLAAMAKCVVESESPDLLALRTVDVGLADYLAHNLQALLCKPVEITAPGVIVRCDGGLSHECTLMGAPLSPAKGAAA